MEQEYATEHEARFQEFRFGLFNRFKRISGIHTSLRGSHYDDVLYELYSTRQRLSLWSKSLGEDDEDQYIIAAYYDELDKLEYDIKKCRDVFISLTERENLLAKSKAKHPDTQQFFETEG